MREMPFSRSAIALLAAAAIALFALSILLNAYEDPHVAAGGRSGPGAFSTSAVGYAGLYDALKRLDWQVERGVDNPLAAVGTRGTLIIAEPDPRRLNELDERKLLTARRLLLVLPKWRGEQDPGRSTWIAEAALIPPGLPRAIANLVERTTAIERRPWPDKWQVNKLGIDPAGDVVAQLMRGDGMEPVVGTGEAMLVGRIREDDREVWVLSDPDVMANHGIGKGENLRFMLSLLNALASSRNGSHNASLVFDETVHGFQKHQGSPLQLLVRFPYFIVTLLLCASGVLAFLAGAGRFGAARRILPNLDFGKARLIDNSARLLQYTDHHAEVLRRYLNMTVRSVALGLHAPQDLDGVALADWLDRIGRSRGVKGSCGKILRTADGARNNDAAAVQRLSQCARDVYKWKGEILDGSGADRRNRQ